MAWPVLNSKDMPLLVAEFVGTYILVFTVGCNVLGGTVVWAVTSIASALMIGIYSLGSISGGHFNPAVTLAVFLSNKMEGGWPQAMMYMTAQVAAGVCAGITYLSLFHTSFNLEPGKGHTWLGAGIVELLYTFMLCFTVLNVACCKATEGNQHFGLAIAFTIIAGGYAVASVSGGVFNPAVGLGVDLSSAHKGFGYSFIYAAFQMAGGALAALVFRVVRAEDFGGSAKTTTARCLSEFIGTFLLTCTVGFNVVHSSAAAAWSIAACLTSMVYALGDVSGAHFNPAVTLAVLLSGRKKMEDGDWWKYVPVQLIAAMCGALVYVGVTGYSFKLAPGMGWFALSISEVIFSFLLCFTVLNVATIDKAPKDFVGLAIGGALTAGVFAGGAAGVCLNPAVGVGIDFGNALRGGTFGSSLVYSVFTCAGAVGAFAAFRFLRPEEFPAEAGAKKAAV